MQLYQAQAAKVSSYHYDIEQSWEIVKKFFTHSWAPSPSQRFLPPCSDMPADLIAATNSIQIGNQDKNTSLKKQHLWDIFQWILGLKEREGTDKSRNICSPWKAILPCEYQLMM